jgi:parallel beta-helix repeat protein
MLLLVTLPILTSPLSIRGGSSSDPIYIEPDGSIQPVTAPITTFDNVIYNFTDNIGDTLVVQRSNVLIDGGGHMGNGIEVSNVNNVTIMNVVIDGIDNAIALTNSTGSCITENVLANTTFYYRGLSITLYGSPDNTISHNNITRTGGIYLDEQSGNNIITGNILEKSGGIKLASSNNAVYNNTCIEHWPTVMASQTGISVAGSDNNITDNIVESNDNVGISVSTGSANRIAGNLITNNPRVGMYVGNTSDNAISNNSIISNGWGVYVEKSSNFNDVIGNNITENFWPIYLRNSQSNKICHNNFFNNTDAVDIDESENYWDDGYPSGGNYWSDYNGTDLYSGPYQNLTGSDGIGDMPRLVNGNNSDLYPLMLPYPRNSVLAIPSPSFTFFPSDPVASQTQILFNASESLCIDGFITDYLWDFGDGTSGQGMIAYHTYNAYGSYNATLIVTSNTRSSAKKTMQLTVKGIPLASFTFSSPTLPSVGQPILFDASSSDPRGGTITTYIWDFDDGNVISTTETMLAHVFANPRAFNISLVVVDSEDLNATYAQSIQIWMPTFVSISTNAPSTLVGFIADITGGLHDFYGDKLKGESVYLSYTFPGAAAWVPITSCVTDNDGHYRAQWAVPATGYFTINAEWLGNATHIGATNNVTLNILPYQNQYVFSVESNSTISDLVFDAQSRKLTFTATGMNGTTGYTKVTVAKSLVQDITNLKVRIDRTEYNYTVVDLNDSWVLSFTYNHSTHSMEVDLNPNAIPEFSPVLIPLLLILATLLVWKVYKRRRKTHVLNVEDSPEDLFIVRRNVGLPHFEEMSLTASAKTLLNIRKASSTSSRSLALFGDLSP